MEPIEIKLTDGMDQMLGASGLESDQITELVEEITVQIKEREQKEDTFLLRSEITDKAIVVHYSLEERKILLGLYTEFAKAFEERFFN